MSVTILESSVLSAHGEPPKTILEVVGAVSSGNDDISVAVMHSPEGWTEPAQTATFEEITVVVSGTLPVHADGATTTAGQAVLVDARTTVRYETAEAASYVAICRPAFRPTRLVRQPDDAGD